MYFLFQTLIVFDNSWIFYFCPLRCAHGHSIQDSLHCLQWEMGGNMTQGISCGIVSAFLVFQLKVVFSQGIHPMVPGGIQVGSGHYISQGIVVSLHHEGLV